MTKAMCSMLRLDKNYKNVIKGNHMKAKLYTWGSKYLPKILPDLLFWLIWSLWRELTESDKSKNVRHEYYNAISEEVEIDNLKNRHPGNSELEALSKSARIESHKAYNKIVELIKEENNENSLLRYR